MFSQMTSLVCGLRSPIHFPELFVESLNIKHQHVITPSGRPLRLRTEEDSGHTEGYRPDALTPVEVAAHGPLQVYPQHTLNLFSCHSLSCVLTRTTSGQQGGTINGSPIRINSLLSGGVCTYAAPRWQGGTSSGSPFRINSLSPELPRQTIDGDESQTGSWKLGTVMGFRVEAGNHW